MPSYKISLERTSVNRLNSSITKKNLRKFLRSIQRRRSLQFNIALSKLLEPLLENNKYKYNIKLRLISQTDDKEETEKNLVRILEIIKRNTYIKDWNIIPEFDINTNINSSNEGRSPFIVPELTPDVYQSYFNDIYEREAHIRLIHDSIQMFARTQGQRRSHILLYGKPASCKTTLFERFKIWYEQNSSVERVVFIDGPTLTKAGFENWILEKSGEGDLPEILVIEEVEKQNMDNLLALLSVMQSGYLMKTNARIGRKQVNVHTLIWATCNDSELLKAFRKGSLWSRFTHRWECSRPSPNLMRKILEREVNSINGNKDWIDKALQIAYDEEKLLDDPEDPRSVIGLLDGQDRLLTGEYLEDLRKIKKQNKN